MNISIILDEQLVVAAELVAARNGTTLSDLVRTLLEQRLALDDVVASKGSSGVIEHLFDYSTGKSSRLTVITALGIDDYGALLRLLNTAGLPHPMVSLSERRAMVCAMAGAIRANEETLNSGSQPVVDEPRQL